MKRIIKSLLFVAATIGLATSCSDVPAPYDLPSLIQGGGKALPYKSTSLNSGWTANSISANNPWSQGSSYTQATGYQDWDGSGSKKNVATEGYLVSPALNTKCASGKVKIVFDQTIRYTNNVSGWEDNEKIFISKDYSGDKDKFNEATWVQLPYVPTASPYSDWTVYTSGDIQVPDSFANCENVYVAFYFKSPATASTTWELMNFQILEGEAQQGGTDTPDTPQGEEITCAKAVELCNALADGATSTETYTITGYITDVFANISNGQQSFWLSDNNDGQKMVQAYWANLPQGVEAFTAGSKVKITGKLLKYVKTDGTIITEVKNANVEILENGGTTPDTPAQGTPVTCAQAIELCNALADGASSEEVYSITGYITDVYATVSRNQQSFWLSDNNDDKKMVQAYWANLPAGVSAFVKGSKVTITGKLLKYVKDGNVTTEIKNADVVILEAGTPDTPDTPDTPVVGEGVTIDGTNVFLANSGVTAGTETISLDLSTLGYTNAQEVVTIEMGDGTTVTFDKNGETNGPKYYDATKGVRVYKNNTITIAGKAKIAQVKFECDEYSGTKYVGNETATVAFDGNNAVYTNVFTGTSGGGVQLRIKTITVTYAQ